MDFLLEVHKLLFNLETFNTDSCGPLVPDLGTSTYNILCIAHSIYRFKHNHGKGCI